MVELMIKETDSNQQGELRRVSLSLYLWTIHSNEMPNSAASGFIKHAPCVLYFFLQRPQYSDRKL